MNNRTSNLANYRGPAQRRRTDPHQSVLEDEMEAKNNRKIAQLHQSATSIKEGAQAIQKHMINEEGILVDIEKGFEKNQTIKCEIYDYDEEKQEMIGQFSVQINKLLTAHK